MTTITDLTLNNFLASFILFVSLTSFIYYAGRVLQYRGKPKFLFYLSYLVYFIISVIASVGNLLTLNFAYLWGVTQEFYGLVESIYKFYLILSSIGFTILALILKIESENPKSYRKRFLNFQIVLGIIIIVLTSLTVIAVDNFQDNFVSYEYNPPSTIIIILAFIISIGLGYGVQSIVHYARRYRKYRKITPFHYVYLFITTLCFIIIIVVVPYRVFVPVPSGATRALISNMIISVFILLPTLRWMYLEQYEKSIFEFEKNTLLDVIAHDLTNITQIMLNTLESFSMKTEEKQEKKDDFEVLHSQVERMSKLIEEARTSIQKTEEDNP